VSAAVGMEPGKSKRTLRDLLDKVIQDRVDANRRSVDEVLEEIQDQNRYSLFRKAWLRASAGKT
jgi:hypothetical protein